MFARVVTTHLKPGKADEAVAIWVDKLGASIKELKGFKGAYLIGDRTSGKGLTISLWETKEDADALGDAFAKNIAYFKDIMAGEPTVDLYEVLLEI